MKKLRLIVLAALLLPALVSQAQTKEETIAWLKDKLVRYSALADYKTSSMNELKLISISECEIKYTYNFADRQVIIVFPTTGMTITKEDVESKTYVYFGYKSNVIRIENFKEMGNTLFTPRHVYVIIENREENIYERIQKAVTHLATFCPKKTETF